VPICPNCGQDNPEGFKFCPNCAAPLAPAAAAREQRKTVTVVFCDVTGSTALGESTDPEALRALLARYFERMKGIVEAHGGTVEKFIGDAVMAVFGVPQVHEDDALRACRAAVEMRDALPELGVQARIGVNTGEVVTGTEERLATGDAVNVAARLEQAAQAGAILIGAETLALVREAVESEPVEPLALKGKAGPVPAHRLVAVREPAERRHEARFVGRERELETLYQAWQRTRDERRCQLTTIAGDPGVGKSRLSAEFLAGTDARVVHGRCLSYGKGITYWPVVEVVKQLDVLPSDPAAAASLRSLLGETHEATSADEIAWAFRKLLEERSPLVCVFDDLQWGEETFLDLVEHVALLSSGAPLLLLCLARPELTERRPQWPIALRLEPLPHTDVEALIPEMFSAELRERIERAAGGNPLFVTEIVAMAREAGEQVAVPPNLKAVLATRLDQLEQPERSLLERGAVEGELFHRTAVQALSGDGQVAPRLAALVRKELVRPDTPLLPGDDAFRFRHLLIRDAAYDALPKATRAELHERFAAWLEERVADLVELDEILGYHLEQAVRYRRELGEPVPDELATAAHQRLVTAARRALLREEAGGAANLLERAAALVPENEIDLGLELDLTRALYDAGRLKEASQRARSLTERGHAADDRIAELCGCIRECEIRTTLEPEGLTTELDALADEALPVFAEADDDLALYTAYFAKAHAAGYRLQMDTSEAALLRALSYAHRIGWPHLEAALLRPLAGSMRYGTTPVSELLSWLDEQERRGLRHASMRAHRAIALAMTGHPDEARSILAQLRADLVDRGADLPYALLLCHDCVDTERYAGDPARAVEFGEQGCKLLEELGERAYLSTAAGKLADAYYEFGRFDDAETWTTRSVELGASDDISTQEIWRRVKAKVLARRGEAEEAERLAREAVAIANRTESPVAAVYSDLAEVLSLAGRTDEAREALERALVGFEDKGNIIMANRMRQRLIVLVPSTSPAESD
jgi:class 3 adenylate cyclase/tetratricopeptide (TPR) repeat protein